MPDEHRGEGAFVQATILDPATGALSVYDPLVVTRGTRPAVVPRVPTIPANAVVTIDFGFNGKDLFPVGATPTTLAQADCVNGQAGSVFGQVSFCNGINFFSAVQKDEREGLLKVPSPGTSDKIIPSGGDLGTGRVCPVTRNFEVVDQTWVNNVTTEYLLNPVTGQTAQYNTSNVGYIEGARLLISRSDNTVLDQFLDPVLGCTPFQAPDLANNGLPTSSLALDEIAAGAYQPKIAALVPENDEMVLQRRRVRRGEDRHVPGGTGPGADQQPEQQDQRPGAVLPGHRRYPDAVPGGQPDAARHRPVAGDGGGRQPAHLHGERAERVLHQPWLPALRPDESRHGPPERRGRGGRGDLQHLRADGGRPGREHCDKEPAMQLQDADESGQRTRAENDVGTSDAAKSGQAVPKAWRSKRFRISVIATALILAAGLGFGVGRVIGLGNTVILSAIPRPATAKDAFIEDDDGIGQDNQANILQATAVGMVHVLSGGTSVGIGLVLTESGKVLTTYQPAAGAANLAAEYVLSRATFKATVIGVGPGGGPGAAPAGRR